MQITEKTVLDEYSKKYLNVCDGERKFLENLEFKFKGRMRKLTSLCNQFEMTIDTMSSAINSKIICNSTVKIEINITAKTSKMLERDIARIVKFYEAMQFDEVLELK